MIRGTFSGMVPGTILGHEGVGIVEEVGSDVRNLNIGDRAVIPSTIGCGYCSYCREGYYAQCDNANPNGKMAGTAFFGGPQATGPFQGLQAEQARIPFTNVGLVKLPDEVSDEQAIMISDIFTTGYFGAKLAEIEAGDTVAVFGCGPVGQFAIASAKLLGAETIDFSAEDPVATLQRLTGGAGPDRTIDAVGVDATRPHEGPAAEQAEQQASEFDQEQQQVAPEQHPRGDNWHPGDAPSQVLMWVVQALAKAGTLSIIGVYPPQAQTFPIGEAMNKNLTIKMGNCNHRRYIPELVELVRTGAIDPSEILTHVEPMTSAIDAYKMFDTRQPGWIKVELEPASAD
jgi:threonine dehydrogenase-like Zn-dependent dehydrogenase